MIQKVVILLCIMSFFVRNTFAFVPLTNRQLNLGSFREGATCGMFYDEIDIISAHPVSLLEYSGNSLYTTWSNVRNSVDVLYNPILRYNVSAGNSNDNTFVFGIVGDPLKNFRIKNSRAGFVFQNLGSKTVYYNLDNITTTGNSLGYDSEGKWQNVDSQNLGGDYQIDYQEIYDADMKYYDNRALNQFNIGFAMKKLLPVKIVDLTGISIARQSDYTNRITGGIKSYKERALNDYGLPTGWPSGTRVLDTYELTYAENNILVNSFDQTDLLLQGRIKDLIPKVRLDLGIGLRIRNDYNPNGLVKTAHRLVRSLAKLNNAGNAVLYDTGEVIRNVVDYNPGGIKELDYDDFSGLLGDFASNDIWRPSWAGGRNLPGLYDFEDDRRGIGVLVRTEAEYKLFTIPVITVFNLSILPQKIDSTQVWRDYIKTRTYNTSLANNPQNNWVARDYTQNIKETGDSINTALDLGMKFDFIKTDYLKVSFGGFMTSLYQVADYKTSMNSVEKVSYDDGISGDTPGSVNLNNRPSPTNGEGLWEQRISSERNNKNQTTTLILSVPLGAEIPITTKWIFRAGTVYNMTKSKRIVKQTSERTTTVTTVTPAGGNTTSQTSITDPSGDDLNESVYYTERHSVSYAYGIEWKPNPNLILACNAFLDMNTNPATTKATIFDLDTLRLLAIQAIFKF